MILGYDEEIRRNIPFMAASGVIERYRIPLISEHLKHFISGIATGLLIGAFVGFILGILMRIPQ